ncbi:hypothetical protein [Caudoviricetes sp.]|nr:hypothetical protein [Caudoviricetes sp.]UOF81132.1 hypothetical protein [Caudoviricetes sp.]UOF82232.1 hypothetical protein [Caudoviricetes sp.]UOF82477.1 hypothetical protein [Caudoviricetes sp.]UOF82631.1 hypothetical protein [Caudoviricetes sp.]
MPNPVRLVPGYDPANSGLPQTKEILGDQPLAPREPTRIVIGDTDYGDAPGTLPYYYDEPQPPTGWQEEAFEGPQVDPTQIPNYEKLSDIEKWMMNSTAGWKDTPWGQAADKFSQNPFVQLAGKGLEPVLGAFDVGAEALERATGFGTQALEAYATGETEWQDFKNNMQSAWYAGSLSADMSRTLSHTGDVDSVGDFIRGFKFDDDLPGNTGLIRARQRIADVVAQGGTYRDGLDVARAEYMDSLGALAFRAQIHDTAFHLLADPLNILLPMIKPVQWAKDARLKVLNLADTEGKALIATRLAETTQALADAKKAGQPADTLVALERSFQEASDIAQSYEQARKLSWGEQLMTRVFGGPDNLVKLIGGVGGEGATELKGAAKLLTPFQLTPQAQAHEYLTNTLNNFLNYFVSPNLTKTGEIDFISLARDMQRVADGTLDPRIAHMLVTPEGRATRTALEGMADVANGIATQRQTVAAVERPLFDLVRDALGVTPTVLMRRIAAGEVPAILKQLATKMQADPALLQRLTSIAERAGLSPDKLLEANQFGSRMATLNVPGAEVYHDQLLLLNLADKLGESVAKKAIVMFGLKERGAVQAFTDALKSAESLAYLRLNPLYPIRNKVNNIVTMVGRGAFGFMGDNAIKDYWKLRGGQPTRLFSGLGPAEVAAKLVEGDEVHALAQAGARGGQAIADVTKGSGAARKFEDWIGKLGDGADNIVGKIGFGGQVASKSEAKSGALALTVGDIQGHRIFGKPGAGILGKARDIIDPTVGRTMADSVLRQLEGIASSARTPAQIDELASAKNWKLNIDNLLDRAEGQLGGLKFDNILGHEFRLGLATDLQKAVDAGPRAVEDFFSQLYAKTENYFRNVTDTQLKDLALEIEAKLTTGGPGAGLELYNQSLDTLRATESAHSLRMAELAEAARSASSKQSHALWTHIKARENAFFENTWRRMETIIDGVEKAGRKAGVATAPITDGFKSWKKTWNDFYSFRDKHLNDFWDAIEKGEKPKLTFDEIQSLVNERYNLAVAKESAATRKLDRGVAQFLPEVPQRDTFLAWRKTMEDIRDTDKALVKEFREEILPKVRGQKARYEAYVAHNKERRELITQAWQEANKGKAALKGNPKAQAQYTATVQQTQEELQLGYTAWDKVQAGQPLTPEEARAWKKLVNDFAEPDEIERLTGFDKSAAQSLTNNRDALFAEANELGIATATESGKPSYNQLLNTLNKHRTPEIAPFTFDELRDGLTAQRLGEARYTLAVRDYDPTGLQREGQLAMRAARAEAEGGTLANVLTEREQRAVFGRNPNIENPQAKMVWVRQEKDKLIWREGYKPKGAPFEWDGSPNKWHRVPGNEVDEWVEATYERLAGGKGDNTATEMWEEIQNAYKQIHAPIPEEGVQISPPRLEDFVPETTAAADVLTAEERLDLEREIFGRYVESTFERAFGVEPTDVPTLSLEDVGIPREYYLSQFADETFNSHGQFALDALKAETLAAMKEPPLNFAGLNAAQQAEARRYLNHAKAALPDINASALRFAEWKRDSALLNYNRRTKFDQTLGMFAPYAFWTTHSGWNWALHSIDRPAMLSTYYRMNKLLREAYNPQPGSPSRFKGAIRVNLPFLPDWMGDQFIDPFQLALPFDNWQQPFESLEAQENSDQGAARRKLDELFESGDITQAEYDEAQSGDGPTFERALTLAQQDDKDNRYDALDFAMAFANPHAPLLWAFNKLRGKTDPTGGNTFLPITRTISAASQALRISPLTRPYIPPGGWNIEAGLRQALGLHPMLDKWQDYRVDRELANMVADGEITVDEAKRAMIDRTGEAYDRARDREGYQRVVNTGSSFLGLPLRGYPEGEEHLRNLADDYRKAWVAYDAGNNQPLDDFNMRYPEYEARLGLYKQPDERMRDYLIDGLWDKWNGLTSLHKREISEQLGPLFERAFLDRELRDYESISDKTLGTWLKLIGGNPPGTLQTTRNDVPPLDLAPIEVANDVQEFYDSRKLYFPGYRELQDQYFAIDETNKKERKAFRNAHPELVAYWDWRREWLDANPEAAPYLTDNSSSGKDTTSGGGGGTPYTYSDPYAPPTQYQPVSPVPISYEQWQSQLGDELMGLVSDYIDGDDLPESMQQLLIQRAAQMGVVGDYQSIIQRIFSAGENANPPPYLSEP